MKAILLAGGLSLIFTLLGTRVAIRVLTSQGLRTADPRRRADHPPHQARHPDDGWPGHHLSVVLAYFVAKLITQDEPSWSGLLLLFLFVGLGTVGFLDDYIKIAMQRSLGLRSKAKMAGQVLVAVIFARAGPDPPRRAVARPRRRRHLSFIRDFDNGHAAGRSWSWC